MTVVLPDNALTHDQAVAWVMDAYGQAVTGVIETGRRLIDLRNGRLHGSWLRLFDKDEPKHLPFSQPTASRFMAIASNPALANYAHVHNLPASWGTLAELARLTPAEIEQRIAAGDLTPQTERSHVQQWIKDRDRTTVDHTPPLPDGIYRVIEADPPWSVPSGPKGPAAQYDVQTTDDIAALPVADRADPAGAHLYLWAVNGMLRDALDVMDAWGFTHRTTLTWIKPRIGLGAHFRTSTEHVLFGVKGTLPTSRNDVPTHFQMTAGRHSQKPAGFYDLVESCSPGPYLRLFARDRRPGWDSWGAEA